jgi:hypothetical protein
MRWALLSAVLAGCGSPVVCPSGAIRSTIYGVNRLWLPMSSNDYAFDLNGDGHVDNKWGFVVGLLAGAGFDAQGSVDQAIADGTLKPTIHILDGGDPADAATVVVADPQPDLSKGELCVSRNGNMNGNIYESATHVTDLKFASTLTMHLPLVGSIVVPSTAVHIRFRRLNGNLDLGQFNVGIKNADVQNILIPAAAPILTAALPRSPTLQSLLDTGGADDGSGCQLQSTNCAGAQPVGTRGCKNPPFGERAGLCADQCDGIIDSCEISTGWFTRGVVAPDVQLFDANGNWAPSSANQFKDSLSFGFGFAAYPL